MMPSARMAVLVLGMGVLLTPAASAQPPSPGDFAMAAAQSDAYEIDAARVAQLQAQDSRIRDFAGDMIRDHGATSQALRAAAAKSGLPPPPDGPSADQARLLSALQSLKGQDFDREYVTQQMLAHQGALTVEEQYAQTGTDANLKVTASAAVQMIRHHVDLLRKIRAAIPD